MLITEMGWGKRAKAKETTPLLSYFKRKRKKQNKIKPKNSIIEVFLIINIDPDTRELLSLSKKGMCIISPVVIILAN